MLSKNITPMPGKALLIRADATVAMGTGHIMRCLALAQAWQDVGGRCCFAIAECPSPLLERLRSEGMEIEQLKVFPGSEEDVANTCELGHKWDAAWIVVDGYHFSTRYQRQVKDVGFKMLLLDDYGNSEHYYADLVLNQNFHAKKETYTSCEPYTELLLGRKYVLLRREFLVSQNWQRHIPKAARKLLITMGGSDPDNLTLAVLNVLCSQKFHDLEVIIVCGAGNPHQDSLTAIAANTPNTVQIVRNACDMGTLMRSADLAITIAGGTVWELFCSGCPSLVYGRDALQMQMNCALDVQGRLVDMGHGGNFDPRELTSILETLIPSAVKRAELSKLCQEYTDGKGALRALSKLQLPLGNPIFSANPRERNATSPVVGD